jgi:peptidoglycan/xylan/chitin deacetylase (PgdA/CDA1 family)
MRHFVPTTLIAAVCALGVAGCIGRESNGVQPARTSDLGNASSNVAALQTNEPRIATSACGLPVMQGDGVPRPSGSPGKLSVLDWAGFRGAVTYTFDDSNSSQIANYGVLNGLGVPLTFYLVTSKPETTDDVWKQALQDGHELGNHTKSHRRTGTAPEVDEATSFFQQRFGLRPWTMAAPYGDTSYASLAESRFLLNRGVNNALIMPKDSSNPFNLPCYIPPQNATAAKDFNPQIDSAQSGGGWRVVLVHGFTGGHDGAYQPVALDEFVMSVSHARSLGDLWIDSLANVGAYWRGQKAFSGGAPTTSGSETTWSWKLPANFPPGKCLRVTVDGGTLQQGNKPLPWDSHGYYEIALDVGSLTLAP